MKIEHVYVDKEGVIFACTVPVPEKGKPCSIPCDSPNNYGYCKCDYIESDYYKAIQSCKDSAVRFEDQDKIKYQLWYNDERINSPIPQLFWWENMIKTDSFYPLQCEVEVLDYCGCDNFDNITPCLHNEKYCKKKKVARLITKAPKCEHDYITKFGVLMCQNCERNDDLGRS